MTHKVKPPLFFWILTLVFLLWNFIGMAFFFTETFASDMIVAQMSEEQAQIYESRPAWYMGNYALAVFTGVVACIALLFKHRSALHFSIVSFVAVLISTIWNFTVGVWEYASTADIVFFLIVPVGGLLLILLSLFARKKHYIN